MGTNDKFESGRPSSGPRPSRNPWEHPGWQANEGSVHTREELESFPPPTYPPPPERPSSAPRTTSVSPIAMPVEPAAAPPVKKSDLLPRIMTITAIGITAVVVVIYAIRGPGLHLGAASRAEPTTQEQEERSLQDEMRRLQESVPAIAAELTPKGPEQTRSTPGETVPTVAPAPAGQFDLVAADVSLAEAEASAIECGRELAPQGVNVNVIFGPTGKVVYVFTSDRPYIGDGAANCIEDQFRRVTVPAFVGGNVAVTRRFVVPGESR